MMTVPGAGMMPQYHSGLCCLLAAGSPPPTPLRVGLQGTGACPGLVPRPQLLSSSWTVGGVEGGEAAPVLLDSALPGSLHLFGASAAAAAATRSVGVGRASGIQHRRWGGIVVCRPGDASQALLEGASLSRALYSFFAWCLIMPRPRGC